VDLAHQGAEVAGNIITVEHSTSNHRGEPSVGNRSTDRAKHAQREEASSTSRNRHLADNDARWRITQNCQQHEYDRDPTDLRNIINDRRHDRARMTSP
jgi:hypothetical protein